MGSGLVPSQEIGHGVPLRSAGGTPDLPTGEPTADDTGPVSLVPNPSNMMGDKIIVLSCFDGIGTGPFALTQLFGPLRKIIVWEVDPEALLVAKHHIVRGDFLDDEPQDVAQTVHDFNHDGEAIVVWLGAPPCPDFSVIKGDDAPGSHGQEGQKFTKFCTFAREVESYLHPIPVGYLVENVVLQDRAEIDYFSHALDCQVVLVDAADYGLVSRPRLWWTRIPWQDVVKHPFTNHPVRWSQHQKLHRLHAGEPHQDPNSIETYGLKFHQSVLDRQKLIPCFTTPSPSEGGRPAPKKLKGRIDPETKSRWLADQRTYAPWQYSPEALLHTADGQMHVPPAEVKEQLHLLPTGYTRVQGVEERSRHRLLANGWHTGVARLLLFLVVTSIQKENVATALPVAPKMSTLQWVAQQLVGLRPQVGPGGWKPPCSMPILPTHCNRSLTFHRGSCRRSTFSKRGGQIWSGFGKKSSQKSTSWSRWSPMTQLMVVAPS